MPFAPCPQAKNSDVLGREAGQRVAEHPPHERDQRRVVAEDALEEGLPERRRRPLRGRRDGRALGAVGARVGRAAARRSSRSTMPPGVLSFHGSASHCAAPAASSSLLRASPTTWATVCADRSLCSSWGAAAATRRRKARVRVMWARRSSGCHLEPVQNSHRPQSATCRAVPAHSRPRASASASCEVPGTASSRGPRSRSTPSHFASAAVRFSPSCLDEPGPAGDGRRPRPAARRHGRPCGRTSPAACSSRSASISSRDRHQEALGAVGADRPGERVGDGQQEVVPALAAAPRAASMAAAASRPAAAFSRSASTAAGLAVLAATRRARRDWCVEPGASVWCPSPRSSSSISSSRRVDERLAADAGGDGRAGASRGLPSSPEHGAGARAGRRGPAAPPRAQSRSTSTSPRDASPVSRPTFCRPPLKCRGTASAVILSFCQPATVGPFSRKGTGTGDHPRPM